MKCFNDTGTTVSNPKCGRKRTVCTKALVDVVRKRISQNPRRSVSELAKTLGVAGTTMRRVVHEHFGMKLYKIQRRQLISALSKEKRLQRYKKLVFTWSDEKIFTVEVVTNSKNGRFLAKV